MKNIIRIGSRESMLAKAQAEIVKDGIQKANPEVEVQIVTMKTTGDRILDRNLDEIGGKGLFVKELDKALLEGRIDLSVHSLKDMPMEEQRELPILAYTRREDPRDVMIYPKGKHGIGKPGIIGSSSKRRTLQVKALYPGSTCKSIRGNVLTRLDKLEQETYDGLILAAAGIRRLHLEGRIGRIFTTKEILPAAGQGILAVQGRLGAYGELLSLVTDEDSRLCALAERNFVRTLDGGCSSPVAAYGEIMGTQIRLTGLYYDEPSGTYEVDTILGDAKDGERMGETLAQKLRKRYL